MTENAKVTAWREYCRKLEAIGVDPYIPTVPAEDSRHEQVAAIVAEYQATTTHKLALPSNWEGHIPIQPVDSLPDLAEWLSFQWQLVKMGELAGDEAKHSTLRDALKAIQNTFRVLEWFGVDDRPERPIPAENLEAVKQQIDSLERWIRKKHKSGWKSSPKKAKPLPIVESKRHSKRGEVPDSYKANLMVKDFLDRHPNATVKDVFAGTGISTGRISGLDVWKRHMAERKANKPPPKKLARQLNEKTLAVKGTIHDPAEKVMEDESIFNWLLEKAQPKERAELHVKGQKGSAELIDMVRERYRKEMSEAKE